MDKNTINKFMDVEKMLQEARPDMLSSEAILVSALKHDFRKGLISEAVYFNHIILDVIVRVASRRIEKVCPSVIPLKQAFEDELLEEDCPTTLDIGGGFLSVCLKPNMKDYTFEVCAPSLYELLPITEDPIQMDEYSYNVILDIVGITSIMVEA